MLVFLQDKLVSNRTTLNAVEELGPICVAFDKAGKLPCFRHLENSCAKVPGINNLDKRWRPTELIVNN